MIRLTRRWPVKSILATLLLVLLSMGATSALAQFTSGTITGTVTDPTGALIPGATVTATDPVSKATRTAVTNKQGQYTIVDLPPASYNVTSTKPGFSTDEIAALIVGVGTQTTANFKMAVGADTTTIEVVASNADLQTLNATTGANVDHALVDSLPAIGRDVSTFVTMQPGVSPGGNVAGTTTDQATFTLDGGSNSSDMDGTQAVYTSSFGNSSTGGFIAAGPSGVMPMPQDSIEEFKVNTTGQTADFNNSSGSQSQIVTKRGRDKWHETVYEYYLDSLFGANTWQGNFPNTGTTSYTAKSSYHYSRFGVAAGGPIAPFYLGGKTYLFVNYEGFRYPAAGIYERTVPSYAFLQQGQLTLGGTAFSATQLMNGDPRGIGFDPTLKAYYNAQLPVAPASNNGAVGGDGNTYAGSFDSSCGALSGTICDSINIIGYKANLLTPQSSNFVATRVDHDFGAKEHLMASYRYYKLSNLTNNQVDIGGVIGSDKKGVPTALTPRPQDPWFFVVGLTTNITPSLTNDFHYSYLRNFWQWKGAGAPPQISGASGVIEPLGESTTSVLAPFNVNAQNIRTRIWDGKDNFFSDNLTKIKGEHLIQFGGQFQHNFNYHQRTDNGASINYTPTYQIGDTGGGGNINYSGLTGTATAPGLLYAPFTSSSASNYERFADTYFGFVTDTQVANTYANVNGVLQLNPAATPFGAHTTIPYYNLYVTDTWHAKPSITLNYGLGYAIEMPPTERNGNQTLFTDNAGNSLKVQDYLYSRQAAALTGAVYNPYIGFALKQDVIGSPKYPYNPYYKALSPRLSLAWNPKFKSKSINKLFGDGATVIRAGYGRLYGRINGDVEVLNPLLSPGLVLATQCKYAQNSTNGTGGCTQTNFNDSTAYRFGKTTDGEDGLAPVLAAAAPPTSINEATSGPYHPGIDGPGVQLASPVDPTLRPNDVDTFNVSIQRQLNRKMLLEVGYIGRLIHHEYIMLNPNTVPYMMVLGGQSFQAAYLAVEQAFGCTTSMSLCSTSTTPTNTITPQPFFEKALGGASSAYCSAYSSCTAAVVAKQASKFRAQQVFALWQALDNNTNGVGGTGWTFNRSLMGTTTSSATYGGAGQIVSGISIGTGAGYSNYNGVYVSFKTTDFHGLTLQENLTVSKALGLGAYTQSTSSTAPEDSFNLKEQYGRQGFDQKVIFNTFVVWQTPWYKNQDTLIAHFAGGWTFSPVVVAGTGQPLTCSTNNSGQSFGGMDGSSITNTESCIFNKPYTGGSHTHRGVLGGADPNAAVTSTTGIKVGTNVHPGGPGAAVNMFTNPVAVWDTVRPPVLGLDARTQGIGSISGLGYLNMDMSVKKNIAVWETGSIELSGVFYNVMNHLDFASPSLSLASPTNFGVTKTQGNSPRQMQFGVRASF